MALFSLDIDNLQQLFVDQLRDLYDAEQQITEALPKMVEKATNPQLKSALQEHLQITRGQIGRLDQIFQALNEKPKGQTCKGMKGIISEGEELVSKAEKPGARDASIITAAQRVEHYEMAGYGTVRTYAKQLEKRQLEQLLEQTLSEEKEADLKLSQIAETANIEAKRAA